MDIMRVNDYRDPRFSPAVLRQHGAFLADGQPCAFEITGPHTAVADCPPHCLAEAVETFRFYAEHITEFRDRRGTLLLALPPVATFPVALADIQPSQFCVDADKLDAVADFVAAPEDVVVPLTRLGGRYVACDGHTRLCLAARRGWTQARGFLTADAGAYIAAFAQEAQARGVRVPGDLPVLPHEEYRLLWDGFCDAFFARQP